MWLGPKMPGLIASGSVSQAHAALDPSSTCTRRAASVAMPSGALHAEIFSLETFGIEPMSA